MNRAEAWGLAGVALAQGAPAGWMLLRWIGTGTGPLEDIARTPLLYAYLVLPTSIVFGAFGYALGSIHERMEEAQRNLERLASVDLLTRLESLRALTDALPRLVSLARRSRAPLSVVAIDIDGFRAINEAHGPETGNDLLRNVAQALASGRRKEDFIARLAADEFAAALPGTDRAGAEVATARMLEAVRRVRVEVAPGTFQGVSASAGIAVFERADDARSLLARAGEALLAAKRAGGDRFAVAPARADTPESTFAG